VGEDARFSGTRTREDQNRTIRALDSSPLNVVKKFALDNHRSMLRQMHEFCLYGTPSARNGSTRSLHNRPSNDLETRRRKAQDEQIAGNEPGLALGYPLAP
jgi:hypothetical protein